MHVRAAVGGRNDSRILRGNQCAVAIGHNFSLVFELPPRMELPACFTCYFHMTKLQPATPFFVVGVAKLKMTSEKVKVVSTKNGRGGQ